MRTSVDIHDDLLRRAKARAQQERVPLRAVIEAALQRYLLPRRGTAGFRLEWKPERGKIQPGVRLDDRDALFDLMDGR